MPRDQAIVITTTANRPRMQIRAFKLWLFGSTETAFGVLGIKQSEAVGCCAHTL